MLKRGTIWPYLKYKDFCITPIFTSDLSYVSLHVVQDDETLYKTDLISVKKLMENLKRTEFYELPMVKVRSKDLRKLLETALAGQ